MKRIFILFITVNLILIAQAQTVYYDAIKLKTYIKNGKFFIPPSGATKADSLILKEYCDILYKYTGDIYNSPKKIHDLLGTYDTPDYNPFIAQFLSPGRIQSTYITNLTKGIADVLPNVGAINVSNLADGLAKFLVKRTKEELNIAFFDQFKKCITNDKFRDLHTLFPATYQTLLIIGDEIYNYQFYLATLQESFRIDLHNLGDNLPLIIDLHPEIFENKALAASLKSAFYISHEILNKVHPGDILQNYPIAFLDSVNLNLKGSVQTMQLISESFRAKGIGNPNYWVESDSIFLLLQDSISFRIFMGLIYQKARVLNIRFEKKTLAELLTPFGKQFSAYYQDYKNYIISFSRNFNRINEIIKNHTKQESDSAKIEQFYTYSNATIDLFQSVTNFSKLKGIELNEFSSKTDKFFEVSRSTTNTMVNINRHNYVLAITNIYNIYKLLFNDIQIASLVMIDGKMGNSINKMKSVPDKILFYGTFIALAADAKTSDEVEAAIEAVALPTGSSRMKRESCVNISLNAYCGYFAGYEKIKYVDFGPHQINFNFKKNWNSSGISAPVGIAFSKGKGCWLPVLGAFSSQHHWSHSLFFSLVDIGALASFRFKDDSTKSVPKIELKDIISPGIFYSIGIAKTPVSVNMGWQLGPRLREVSSAITNIGSSYTRFSISLCVDIPIFNFYNKPR